MLIGNKLDIIEDGTHTRAISKEDIDVFCDNYGLKYFETSAKTGFNVKQSFKNLVETIFDMGTANPGNVPNDGNTITLTSHLHK
jgi:Ras-related protein Rab-5C